MIVVRELHGLRGGGVTNGVRGHGYLLKLPSIVANRTQQGDKIRSGYLTPAFSGAHKWAELLHNPCILGGPQTRGQNQKWLPHPCLLWGPQVGGIAT